VDQPCCAFEPRIVCLREGQMLVVKNSSSIPHGVKIDGPEQNPSISQVVPASGQVEVPGFKRLNRPAPAVSIFSCNLHSWMRGYIRAFDHPYFAVTDEQGRFEIKNAPAGKWNLVVWQEEVGYVVTQPGKSGAYGVPIEIKAGAVSDVGPYKLTPPKEEK
jgi:hypothetical protein